VLRQVEQGEAVGREPRVVAEPGYFSLFIFVLSPADISGLGPGALWAFNPEEVICDEGGCTEITQGLYLAVDALPPQDYLIDLLEKSIGLESRDDEYEPGYHPAEGSPRDLSRLAICVDAVGEARETRSDSVKAVRDAMSKVQEHEIWAKANFGSEPIVDEGCPAGPSLYDPESGPFPGESLFFVRGRVVDRPSYYWEFVFVVPAEDIPTENETRGWRFTREEVTCSGDNCVEATGGLYLTPNDVADEAFLVDQLEKAVGLEDPTDPLRPGYYPEEPD